jgi:NAD(P)-dependent dehydrogenase (short-subunit alcohol dehydrogenase family)
LLAGIGQCCALYFARSGCEKLFLVDLKHSKLEETAALIRKETSQVKIELFEADVSSELSVQKMVDQCIEVYGRLDIACNNAGIGGGSARTSDISVKDYDQVCAVNERGVSAILLLLWHAFQAWNYWLRTSRRSCARSMR